MPRLGDVGNPVERVRELGLDVALTTVDMAPLDRATSLAGYRVLQESLTNVIKHAMARRAEVPIHNSA